MSVNRISQAHATEAEAVADAVIDLVLPVTSTSTQTRALAPGPRVPIAQLIVPTPPVLGAVQVPWLIVIASNVVPSGTAIVMLMPDPILEP